jgi:hypothetical protein
MARVGAAAIACTCAIAAGAAAQPLPPVHFEDHEFGSGSVTVIQGGWGLAGGAQFSTAPAGGNPGSGGEVNISVTGGNPGPLFQGGSTSVGVFVKNGWSLDPAALGGIVSISYSLDSRFVAASIGGGCQCSGQGFLVRQGGRLYMALADQHTTSVAWGTHQGSNLVATSFAEVLFGDPAYFNSSSNPDFSATGAPIEVAFSRGNSNGPAPSFPGYNVTTRADNFVVTALPCMRLSELNAESRTCASGAVSVAFSADPAYPVSAQWQIDDPKHPGAWLTLTDGPQADDLTFTGTGTTSLGVAPTGAAFRAGVVRTLRCVVSNDCSTTYRTTTLRTCIADFNCDGTVNSTDVSDFINQWFADQIKGSFTTDWDANGVVNSTDVSSFINSWFDDTTGGCG